MSSVWTRRIAVCLAIGLAGAVVGLGVGLNTRTAAQPYLLPRPPAVAELPDTMTPYPRPRPGMVYVGQVHNVVDGDTLDIEISYYIRIRLLECWAPEKKGPELADGMASHRNLIGLAAGKHCVVEIPMDTDVKRSMSLDRLLGRVWVDGDEDDLSTQQVRSGHAVRKKKATRPGPGS